MFNCRTGSLKHRSMRAADPADRYGRNEFNVNLAGARYANSKWRKGMSYMNSSAQILVNAKSVYDRDGWYRHTSALCPDEVALLCERVDWMCKQSRPEVVYEQGSHDVRAIHGCHRYDDVCAQLTRLPRLVDLAEALIGEPIYVYQFKINLKQPFRGVSWPWHQDFAFWREEDGMPAAKAVNLALLLDTADLSNGPLLVISGSQRRGLLNDVSGDGRKPPHGDWRNHVSADLTYTVGTDVASQLAAQSGTTPLVGPPGTIYAFHPSIVHSSSDNRSPHRRALLLITYNAVSNAPANPTRPAFLVDPDTTPVARLSADRLLPASPM
jgi:ectoine hydroxylase